MAKANPGSKTKGQSRRTLGTHTLKGAIGSVCAANTSIPGLIHPCPLGTYDTYRAMRSNPTIAIARAALFAPVKANQLSYEAKDGTPDDRVKFIQETFEPLKLRLIQDVLRAVEYGWQPFERVYGAADGRYVYSRIKALLPDDSTPIVDKETYTLLGVENCGVKLTNQQAAVVTYDQEGDDPYGRSIYENIREDAWWPWKDAAAKMCQYYTKGAGVIPIIRYPLGQQQDENGANRDNSENAASVLRTLGVGMGVAMPNTIDPAFEDMARAGADVGALMAWQISFLETRSGVGGEIEAGLRHYERLMVRGMLQPERAIIEGQFGTKADAGSHGDLGLLIATEMVNWALDRINRLFVDPLLSLNFGPDARGSVYISPSPIRDDDKEFLRNLMAAVFNANPDLLMAVADFDAMLDSSGIPKSAEVVDVAQATTEATASQVVDVPGTVDKVMTEGTGDAVADTALNGAQVQSMVEIVKEVAGKQLPADAAKGILRAAFPTMPQPVIDKIINSVAAFNPKPHTPTPTMASLARRIEGFRRLGIA